ncbi:hypothetical protein [Streptomyces sp. x-80]|uniref:hypothetical protein n=1 Tax=Streptomyces sp. x-80 TaxID=2789282 RepID=UPI00397EA2EC
MMAERGMVVPVAGGSILAQFDGTLAAAAAASELAGRARAVAFDADTGRLDVAPDAPACGTKPRWSARKPIAATNAKTHGANVRAVHVLPPVRGRSAPPQRPPWRGNGGTR